MFHINHLLVPAQAGFVEREVCAVLAGRAATPKAALLRRLFVRR